MKIYQRIKQLQISIHNCEENGNTEWQEKHESSLHSLMQSAPSGSGFDAGTKLSEEENYTTNRIVFITSFHHMNNEGFYSGWSEHKVIVSPDLQFDFILKVTGRDKNNIKSYIEDVFNGWLSSEIITNN